MFIPGDEIKVPFFVALGEVLGNLLKHQPLTYWINSVFDISFGDGGMGFIVKSCFNCNVL